MNTINKKIKEYRRSRGLTLEALARKTGLTRGYLSRIENAQTPPPFATVERIAAALGMDMTGLFAEPKAEERPLALNPDIVAPPDEKDWNEPDAIYTFRPLVNSYTGKYMTPFEFCVKRGTTEVTTHDSEEFVYVRSGEVTLLYEGAAHRLKSGHSFYLDARLKHNFVNEADEPAYLISVHFNYRRF